MMRTMTSSLQPLLYVFIEFGVSVDDCPVLALIDFLVQLDGMLKLSQVSSRYLLEATDRKGRRSV